LLAGLIGLSCLSYHNVEKSGTPARSSTFIIGGFSLLILLPSAMNGLEMLPIVGQVFFPIQSLAGILLHPIFNAFGQHFSLLTLAALVAFIISLIWWVLSGKADQTSLEGI
jgi:hypothetical protein